MRRRGNQPGLSPHKPTPTPSPSKPTGKIGEGDALEFTPGRMDHTPPSRQFSSSEFFSTRKNLDPLFGNDQSDTTHESPLNQIASQLQSDFDETIDQAAERLQTLAVAVDEAEVGDIITSGVIPPLIKALDRHASPEEELAALQNLGAANDTEGEVKRHMIACGVVPAVMPFLEAQQTTVARLAVAVVLNLAIDSEERKSLLVEAGVTEKIALLMDSPDTGLVSTTINALTSLSIGSEYRKKLIEQHGCLNRAVELLQEEHHDLQLELLGFIQSLVYCNDERKRRLLRLNFIPIISLLLADPESSLTLKETASRLLKGLAGFSAHEAKKSPSKAARQAGRRPEPPPPNLTGISVIDNTVNMIADLGDWATTMVIGHK